ncbi:MAG: hypothetical protein GMKNLPBB_00091 [Myxococcota bacterium]|nr:hypothetical protein [Myxococcota bacterium]
MFHAGRFLACFATAALLFALIGGVWADDGAAGAAEEALKQMYATNMRIDPGSPPVVSIGLMDGQGRVDISATAALVVTVYNDGETRMTSVKDSQWRVQLEVGKPAKVRHSPVLEDISITERSVIEGQREYWTSRGFRVRESILGMIFGISGRVMDNRRVLLLADSEDGSKESAQVLADDLFRRFAKRAAIHEELERLPGAAMRVSRLDGSLEERGRHLVSFRAGPGAAITVKEVEYGRGYKWHSRQTRRFHGEIVVVVDPDGTLAVVNRAPLEQVLYGLVPSEIQSSAHPGALKAQAVTARGEVLAKIGNRHLAHPWHLCSEQHCQVYSGAGHEHPRTNAAVDATRGEVMFRDNRVADAFYSSTCGGHTEHNDIVWAQQPDGATRGKPDLVADGSRFDIVHDGNVRAFIEEAPQSWCSVSSLAPKGRFRWSVSFPAADVNAMVQAVYPEAGSVNDIQILGRGVSGRVTGVRLTGEHKTVDVQYELPVRRLFNNLNSGLFVVDIVRDANGKPVRFDFRGAGWGHGVGMCQMGAVGRAERGQDYKTILQHYYSGVQVLKIY